MEIVECWIEHPVRSLDRTFTYLSDFDVEVGCRVKVPFGRKDLIGFVESAEHTEETKEQVEDRVGYRLKYIQEVIDTEPLITEELHDLALWMRRTTLSTAISCFQAMLPAKLKPSSSSKKAVKEKWIKLTEQECSLTPKQFEAFQYLIRNGEVRYSELRKNFGIHARALIEKGAAVLFEKEKTANLDDYTPCSKELELTEEQRHAKEEIEHSEEQVFLLKGVTGAGKTEVYLQLAMDVLRKGKQVLFLVPEISLTPQMINRVSQRFGNTLAVYHSGLNAQQKYEQYRLVKNGKVNIVVGTRSAIFLPFENIGLIVVDEEHDGSYKQENQPCYHARDIAIWRGNYHHCKVILGSATPSLDSYARAMKQVYHLIRLDHRINDSLPKVTIVSMKEALKNGESEVLSDCLKEKIQERLFRKEQVILLLNRRGYHTQVRCRSCNEVIVCPHCDLAMSWHRDEKVLKCHTCGTQMYLPRVCPKCGSRAGFTAFGFGTQKLEMEVQQTFPTARILRMDADTTSRKDSHEKILNAFAKGKADILLGTQMIAKGLDYPNVTLVGVINGDEGLNRTDFRSCEMTFDLLMQAGGRSGRGERSGEVVYQVFDSNHYAVQCAARQDYDSFYQYEMKFRHAGMYPPYTYLISLTFSAKSQRTVDAEALRMKDALNGDFKVIGVISLLKIADRYRNRILLKGRNLDTMRQTVQDYLDHTEEIPEGLRIDVNPMVLD